MTILKTVLFGFALANFGAQAEDAKKIDGPVIGIDLGTTFSCVAIMKESNVEIIANDQGSRITPSYVAFTPAGRLLGEAAKNEAASQPTQTVFDVKRLIGRRLADKTVQEDVKTLPYTVLEDDEKLKISVVIGGEKKLLTPEEVSAMVLAKMKETAEAFLGEEVRRAVITVPAYFNNAQREATKDAGAIAGLEVLRIINEPTAAALAYGLDKKDETNILVYDLGGGTFDVSLLTVADGVIEVLATNGDTHLGGEDFDQRVADYLKTLFEEKHNKKLGDDKKALHKLKQAAEKAKIALSSAKETSVEVENLADGIDLVETLTRAKFEELNHDLFKKTLEPLKRVLEDGKMQASEIDEIVTVGGSTRIPKIQDMLSVFFRGKALNRRLNPDEAVAYGAAVQAGILSGVTANHVVLLDVTPISLGIETAGGIFETMVSRNTALPVKKSRTFVTSQPGITETHINVYEGERRMIKDNNELGKFVLSGFSEHASSVEHEVTFNVDVNGIMTISAKIKSNGKENSMTITKDKQRLTSGEIDKMVKEAEEYAEKDRVAVDKAKEKNDVNTFIHSTEFKLKKIKSKMSDEDKKVVEDAVADARKLLTNEAPEGVEKQIVDPDAKMPADWNEEEDGEWSAPMIDNPEAKDIPKLLGEIKEKAEPVLEKYPVDEESEGDSSTDDGEDLDLVEDDDDSAAAAEEKEEEL
eukprot:TRINITY_DN56418_c0_g1_i1.p1 TRINITY_DN56418_c0_g1~~TRINITY_DN56418_c0_g1_i1.p1  ORF type:complete len:710 (+),score=227.97 TRINITY_DN56418_c0_g1_i1:38-2131(+)